VVEWARRAQQRAGIDEAAAEAQRGSKRAGAAIVRGRKRISALPARSIFLYDQNVGRVINWGGKQACRSVTLVRGRLNGLMPCTMEAGGVGTNWRRKRKQDFDISERRRRRRWRVRDTGRVANESRSVHQGLSQPRGKRPEARQRDLADDVLRPRWSRRSSGLRTPAGYGRAIRRSLTGS
jgi:hypothetical protein